MKNILFFLLLSFPLVAACQKDKQNLSRPNVVIVLTDDLGYGDVSKYNAESKIHTPNIDALADEGVWSTDAHSGASICSPSRYALLTGRYAWRGKLKKGIVLVCDEPVIEVGRLTLPQMLKDKGYNTACIGKWHLGFNWPWKDDIVPSSHDRNHNLKNSMFDWSKPITGGPLAIGFDHYFGDDVPNFPPYAFIEDSALTCQPIDIDQNELKSIGVRGGFHGSGPGQEGWKLENVMPVITQKAVDYIENMSKEKEPFFLYFATTSPHTPIVPVDDFQGTSKAGYYGDYVQQTDDAIGQVIRALKENGSFDNTLLIVASDNGPSKLNINVIQDYNHFPAAYLRGMKFDSWEGGHRIPFVASWPAGKIAGGKKTEALVSIIDIFATVADIVGYDLPENAAEDSYNVLSTLRDLKPVRKELVYHCGSGELGLRHSNWVYLEDSGGKKEPDWLVQLLKIQSPDDVVQLFNLNHDPGQKINVKDRHPDQAKEMMARLSEIRKGSRTNKMHFEPGRR
jgi:arylsulfatase A